MTLLAERQEAGLQALGRLGASLETFSRITADLEEAYERLHERAERIDLELAETNRRLAAILASLPVGMIVTDENGRIADLNPTAATLLGVREEDWRGMPLATLRTADGEPLVGDSLPASTMAEVVTPEGTKLLRLAISEVAGARGTSQGHILTLEDLTEVEALRREVHRLDKLAALGEMSARLAHQIRNPLNGMQGFAEMLSRGLRDQPNLRSHAGRVLEGARDLNRIVSNMLTFARTPRGRVEPCSAVRAADAAVCWLRERVGPEIRVRVRHDDPHHRVLADRFHLEESLRNLLLNAAEVLPRGGLIRVRTRVRDGRGEITVSDTGPGVPPELRRRIFEPFVTGRERGTGLGLAIVRSVADQANGELELRPSGRGARFRLRLRLSEVEQGGPA
jgi:PAS domain S-box-containing protein